MHNQHSTGMSYYDQGFIHSFNWYYWVCVCQEQMPWPLLIGWPIRSSQLLMFKAGCSVKVTQVDSQDDLSRNNDRSILRTSREAKTGGVPGWAWVRCRQKPTLAPKQWQRLVPREGKGTRPWKTAPVSHQIIVTLQLLGGAAFTERNREKAEGLKFKLPNNTI